MFAYLLIVASVVLLQSCSASDQARESHSQANDPEESSSIVHESFTKWDALQVLYDGNYDQDCQCIIMHPTFQNQGQQKRNERYLPKVDGPMRLDLKHVLWEPFVEREGEHYFLLVELQARDKQGYEWTCHACSAIIGAAVFSRHVDQWVVDAASPFLDVSGEYGSSGTDSARLVKIGPNRHGVFWEEGPTGGYGRVHLWLEVVAEVEGKLRFRTESIKIYEDSKSYYEWSDSPKGASEPQKMGFAFTNSACKFIPGSNPDYYDLQVISGQLYGESDDLEDFDFEEEMAMPFQTQRTRIYTFDGTQYKLVSEKTDPVVTLSNPGVLRKTITSHSLQ